MSDTNAIDAVVIGAGIAGTSVAYFMSSHAKVLVLERERIPACIRPAARRRFQRKLWRHSSPGIDARQSCILRTAAAWLRPACIAVLAVRW
jgi:glycine/D-amino acid oxidase-like deaminating enzyme